MYTMRSKLESMCLKGRGWLTDGDCGRGVEKNLDTLVSSLTLLTFTLHDNTSSMKAPPLFPRLCLELTVFINVDWACSQDTIVSKCISLTALIPCSLFISHYAFTRSKGRSQCLCRLQCLQQNLPPFSSDKASFHGWHHCRHIADCQ